MNKRVKEFLDKSSNYEVIEYMGQLQQENQKLKIQISAREEEYRKSEELLNTILNFEFFKNECPLNLGFEKDTNEDKAQDVFYEDEYCENNCNDDYRKCWLKYFEKMQELEQGSDSNE